MKIKVTGHQKFRLIMDNNAPIEIEMDKCVLRDVLNTLSVQFGEEIKKMIFDVQGKQVKRSNLILVNGQSYLNLRKRLDSELRDGDEITILPALTGG